MRSLECPKCCTDLSVTKRSDKLLEQVLRNGPVGKVFYVGPVVLLQRELCENFRIYPERRATGSCILRCAIETTLQNPSSSNSFSLSQNSACVSWFTR